MHHFGFFEAFVKNVPVVFGHFLTIYSPPPLLVTLSYHFSFFLIHSRVTCFLLMLFLLMNLLVDSVNLHVD